MSIAVVTGSGGLVGGEAARLFSRRGLHVVGVDNDMRACFFGPEASTAWQSRQLARELKDFTHQSLDIRDNAGIDALFARYGQAISVIVHCAAQPSHDWAAREPHMDFTINANGTLNLLEAARRHCPSAVFIFTSTNKVYGDRPNTFELVELDSRFELTPGQRWAEDGFDEDLSIDQSMHSLFGVSKIAADVMVQEYGRYFGLKTVCFRCGCLTGAGHSPTQLHGFLAYLVKCAVSCTPYTIFGYKGKQVRDNIHAKDLVEAFWAFFQNPRAGEVYNMGGGRFSNCSMIEAITIAETVTSRPMRINYQEANRQGDHIWWISDVRKFQSHYPDWSYRYDIPAIMEDICEAMQRRPTSA